MNVEQAMELNTWAVVGASDNPEKYGYKIYRKLKQLGYKVFAVNPNYETLQGDRCYPDLSSLPEVPDVVNMVVAPKHGMKTVEEAANLSVKYIWFQPGTVNDELLKLAADKGIDTIQACILVEGNKG